MTVNVKNKTNGKHSEEQPKLRKAKVDLDLGGKKQCANGDQKKSRKVIVEAVDKSNNNVSTFINRNSDPNKYVFTKWGDACVLG